MNASLNKILLATDGSREATLAGQAAADISGKTGADLHVVRVRENAPLPPHPGSVFDDNSRLAEQVAGELLRRQGRNAWVAVNLVTREHLKDGDPAEEIVALAEELDADLVVVGSRGAGLVKRLITGSVSEGVVHRARCPVLVVRDEDRAWPPARIVVGDDGSGLAKRAGGLAAEIARLFDAEVVLVRAYENPPKPVGGWSAHDRRELDEELQRRREDLDERAECLAALTRRRPETKLIETQAVPALSSVAQKKDEGPTLLAVGGREPGTIERALSGSVSTKVLRSARGPVLLVPPEKVSAQ